MHNPEHPTTLADCVLYTREQTARLLNLSMSMVDKLRKSGHLKACHVTSVPGTNKPKPMFHRDELERFARSMPIDH